MRIFATVIETSRTMGGTATADKETQGFFIDRAEPVCDAKCEPVHIV
jgi:hypothetical protein